MKHLILSLFICLAVSVSAQTYFVGHTSVNFKDASRTGGYAINGGTVFPTGDTGRDIGTEIYYPATITGDNKPFSTGQFPVVVFGHGFAMGWDSYKTLTDSLVKNGYIVALPRTEGSLLPAPSHLDFGKDLAKVADLLLQANSTSGSFFNAKLTGREAIGGHSMGGGATFLSDAFTNSNVICYFTFAAAETNPSAVTAAASITKPHLVFSGTYDCVAPPATHQDLMYNALTTSVCRTKIALTKAYHCAFADNNFNCGFGEGTCITQGGLTSANQQLLVRRYLNPYLDYYLKGICPAWTKFEDLTDTISVGAVLQTCNNLIPSNAEILGDTVVCTDAFTTLTAIPSGFNYLWSDTSNADTLSVNSAGTYSVAVSNGVCTLPAVSVYVTTAQAPVVPTIVYSDDTLCAGDTLQITATSNADYYRWSTPQGWSSAAGDSTAFVSYITGQETDTIVVTAVNSCGTASNELDNIVILPSTLTIGNIRGDSTACFGTLEVYRIDSVLGADHYEWIYEDSAYEFNKFASFVLAFGNERIIGVLSVTAVNECTVSEPVSINISIDTVVARITQIGNTLYTADLPGYYYQWSTDTGAIQGANNASYTITSSGFYRVFARSPYICFSSDTINVSFVGINEAAISPIQIYPNPVKRGDILNLPFATQVKVYNHLGALMYEAQQVQQINTATFAAGIYVLMLDGNAARLVVE